LQKKKSGKSKEQSFIISDVLSGGRDVSTEFFPGSFRAFELKTVVINCVSTINIIVNYLVKIT